MLGRKNYVTTKANVLKYLQPKLKKSKIEKIFDFTVVEWDNEKKIILSKIKKQFKKGKIIIRSSAIGEDSIEKSNAGIYESVLNVKVYRSQTDETTALGAAFMAGLQIGIFKSLDDVSKKWQLSRKFVPKMRKSERVKLLKGWSKTIRKTLLY